MRYEIIGPKTTWYSRLEGVPEGYLKGENGGGGKGKEKEQGEGFGKEEEEHEHEAMESGRRRLIEVIGEQGKVGWNEGQEQGRKAAQEARDKEEGLVVAADEPVASTSTSTSSAAAPPPQQPKIDFSHPLSRLATTSTTAAKARAAPRPAAGCIPGYSRNYLIVDLDVDEWGAELVVEKKPSEEEWRVAVLGQGGKEGVVEATSELFVLFSLSS